MMNAIVAAAAAQALVAEEPRLCEMLYEFANAELARALSSHLTDSTIAAAILEHGESEPRNSNIQDLRDQNRQRGREAIAAANNSLSVAERLRCPPPPSAAE